MTSSTTKIAVAPLPAPAKQVKLKLLREYLSTPRGRKKLAASFTRSLQNVYTYDPEPAHPYHGLEPVECVTRSLQETYAEMWVAVGGSHPISYASPNFTAAIRDVYDQLELPDGCKTISLSAIWPPPEERGPDLNCEECGGSGWYTGFLTREKCRSCGIVT